MHKVQSTAVVRWMADRDLAVCGALNRMSRPPKIKKFFVVVSWLGNGKVWYLLMVACRCFTATRASRHPGLWFRSAC